MSVVKRGGVYHLRRRVPVRFKSVEDRTSVYVSLKTDSETMANAKAPMVWERLVKAWEDALAGQTGDSVKKFEQAQKLAVASGFEYMGSAQVAELPIKELLARVEAIEAGVANTNVQANAVLGGVERPKIKVSKALEMYWDLTKLDIQNKSPDQVRRWINPRKKAVKNFILVCGDKPIDEITQDDMFDFRDWWEVRILDEGVTGQTANKDFIHLRSVLKTVNSKKRLQIALPNEKISLPETEPKERPPFSDEWIKTRLLAPGALDGLNDQARAIFKVMMNTGLRLIEIASLTSEEICLDDPKEGGLSYVQVLPIGRELKTRRAKRRVPLLGVSLEALRAFPEGFSTYRGKSATLSMTLNKYLRENDLKETEDHVVYSLRHRFEDRMLKANMDERIRRDLMGHSLKREKYGKGADLEDIVKVMLPYVIE